MFRSLEEIIQKCDKENKEFWEIVLEDDIQERQTDSANSYARMTETWDAMLLAVVNYDKKLKSSSGLIGGDGDKMEQYISQNESLCGEFLGQVIVGALQMGESNACMKRIVAAPTAGACGVLPAILVPYFKRIHKDSDRIIRSMYVAAGIGQVIALRASISGAQGGCQAEIGSASAMSSGALVYLEGGDCNQIIRKIH